MEKNINLMVCSGIKPEELTIQHVRKPGKWMPVTCNTGSKGPLHSRPGQAVLDDGIFINVSLIVVIDEIVSEHLAKTQLGDRDEKNAG